MSVMAGPDLNTQTLRRLQEATGQHIVPSERLARHTSLGIGGPADYFVAVPTVEALIEVVRAARSLSVPYLVIGNGSNLLVNDGGVRGLVIKNKADAVRVTL